MADLDLTGAQVLTPEGLNEARLSISGGLIADGRSGREVDVSGYLVLPGIVDAHGDGFERHVAPRRGAMKQVAEGLVAVEAEVAANGITTATLAQFISWEGGVRGPEFGAQVFEAIRDIAPSLATDIRGQLRFETHLLELYEELPDLLEAWGVRYVVFNDHLPHDRLAEGQAPQRLVAQALKAGRSPEQHLALMQDLHGRSGEVPDALDWLCNRLSRQGTLMGSHDDQTAASRQIWQARSVTIAEFPETVEAASATAGPVVLGAPNLVRGGSHNGNVSALDLVMMGNCTALASDYHYPSPRRAALMLWKTGALDLGAAWHLVSAGPSELLGLSDRGSLVPGRRADIVFLDAQSHRVCATMAAGRFSYLSGDIAERFLG